MNSRVPCINPRCRRTFKADDTSDEIICGKCFRTLPESTRKEHRTFWREIRKWDRRIARTSDEIKILRMREIRSRLSDRLNRHWAAEIRAPFVAPEKPDSIDAFLEEMGL